MNRFTKNLFPSLITDYRSLITVPSSPFILFTSCLFLLILNSCNSTEPVTNKSLYVAALDAFCTEVWLEIKTENISLPIELEVLRNDEKVGSLRLTEPDTVLVDSDLLPSTNYKYQITGSGITSKVLTITTMDTTSHDFTWETFTFGGEGGSSYLLDVAIIDENNIWAVGMIFTADDTYNAVHWDGSEWELKRINYGGHFWTIRSLFAFDKNEIWFSAFVRFDGERFIELPIPEELTGWRINKTWGISSSDFYVVGNNGNIAHYNGSTWKKIASGTVLDFQDIWGDYNEKFQEWEVLAVASNHLSGYEREIVKIEGDRIRSISNEPLTSTISSTWFISSRKYLIGGSGIYSKAQIDQINWQKENTINKYYTYKIRGNSINDIVAVGGYGDLQHYNGINWRSQYEITKIEGNYRSVSLKGKIAAAVGQHNAQAVITIGRR